MRLQRAHTARGAVAGTRQAPHAQDVAQDALVIAAQRQALQVHQLLPPRKAAFNMLQGNTKLLSWYHRARILAC